MPTKKERLEVFERDKGICAFCGTDTEALKTDLRAFKNQLMDLGEEKEASARKKINKRLKDLGYNPDKSLWEVHHVEAETHGGANNPDNYLTLCVPCHKAESRKQAGADAKEKRVREKTKPRPEVVKTARKKSKMPNLKMPGVNSPAWSLGEKQEPTVPALKMPGSWE